MPLSDYPSRSDGKGKGLHTEESPRQKDLLRWTVHLLLTVYLLPAICLVILVGLMAVLADGLVQAFVWLAHRLPRGRGGRCPSNVAVGTQENRLRGPLVRRNPSHARGRDNEQTQEDLSSRVCSRLPTTPNDGAGASQA